MPRPKRTKIASNTARVGKPPQPTIAAKAVAEHSTVTKASACIESFSDDSDGLVVRSTRARVTHRRDSMPQVQIDISMTGALPIDGVEQEEGMGKSINCTPASKIARKGRVDSLSAKAPSSGQSQIQERPTVRSLQDIVRQDDEDDSISLDNLLSFDSLDSDSPAHGTRPPSAMKVGGTPAHETSILALTNFKRRARQPSLLRMVQQRTDVEEPSLDDLVDLDDFDPADASTPLHVRESVTKDKKSSETTTLSLLSVSSRGKKRKLSPPVIQVPRSSPPYDPPSGADIEQSQRSSSPSLPDDVVQSTEDAAQQQEQADPEIFSETMAPPRSSSTAVDGVRDSPERSRSRTRGRNQRTAKNDSSDDEPSTRARRKTRRNAKTQTISTAKLQALLPRRRTHASQDRDEYDVQSSSEGRRALESDEDELQLSPRQAARSRKTPAPKAKKKTGQKEKKSTPATRATKKITKTYAGRRTSSDKENESTFVENEASGDTSGISERTTLPKSQRAAIAKKFEEVDAWEMDFEDVDTNGVSSSPWR